MPAAAPAADVADGDDESVLPSAGERRRATVLVSVVSEYASLVERLAPHEIDNVIGGVRAAASTRCGVTAASSISRTAGILAALK